MQFASIEALLDGIADLFPIFKSRQTLYRAGVMALFYILNLLYCTQVNKYISCSCCWTLCVLNAYRLCKKIDTARFSHVLKFDTTFGRCLLCVWTIQGIKCKGYV